MILFLCCLTASKPCSKRHFCADGPVLHAMMPPPGPRPDSTRRSSADGVLQVPGISRGSTSPPSASGTPSAAEGISQPVATGDFAGETFKGHHSLYAVPEAGESQANMLASESPVEVLGVGDEGVGEGGSEGGSEVDVAAQQFHSIEGTPKATD